MEKRVKKNFSNTNFENGKTLLTLRLNASVFTRVKDED